MHEPKYDPFATYHMWYNMPRELSIYIDSKPSILARSSPDEGKSQNQEIVDKILIFVSSKIVAKFAITAKPWSKWNYSDHIRLLDGNIVPRS